MGIYYPLGNNFTYIQMSQTVTTLPQEVTKLLKDTIQRQGTK